MFDDQVRAWLQPALDICETHDIEHIEEAVGTGHMQLWVGERGAAVTEINRYPKKKCLNVFLAGGEMDQVLDFIPSFRQWAEMNGCAYLTFSGRKGWKRVLEPLGWTQTALVMKG